MSVRIHVGDVRAKLAELPAESIDCVVTSPPYWGLRDYGVDGQIGLEATLGEHIDVMVEVFRAVRRVMKPPATLWLNYGDCYATKPNGRSAADTRGAILKPKDLCLIPERVAIALQEDGWWVRAKNVWGKPNAMPDSSGKYRPSVAHEMVWMLSKSANCYYDAAAVAQPTTGQAHPRCAGWTTGDDIPLASRKCAAPMGAASGSHAPKSTLGTRPAPGARKQPAPGNPGADAERGQQVAGIAFLRIESGEHRTDVLGVENHLNRLILQPVWAKVTGQNHAVVTLIASLSQCRRNLVIQLLPVQRNMAPFPAPYEERKCYRE